MGVGWRCWHGVGEREVLTWCVREGGVGLVSEEGVGFVWERGRCWLGVGVWCWLGVGKRCWLGVGEIRVSFCGSVGVSGLCGVEWEQYSLPWE